MTPGSQSKLSVSTVTAATTIYVKTDIVLIASAATTIQNIFTPVMGSNTIIFLGGTGGAILGNSGNIQQSGNVNVNQIVMMVWEKTLAKWFVSGGI